jgi:hypothetical protein|tara:strand:+ start:162 stop:455 length:294 start_codon:yes stop_codon:yes gene_type:complete
MANEKKWDKKSFIQSWIAASKATTWDGFHRSMNKHSKDGGFGGINEKVLALRCGAVRASLSRAGYEAPAQPERPRKTPTEIPMAEVASALGLKKKKK